VHVSPLLPAPVLGCRLTASRETCCCCCAGVQAYRERHRALAVTHHAVRVSVKEGCVVQLLAHIVGDVGACRDEGGRIGAVAPHIPSGARDNAAGLQGRP
jgi:hypothetical protein